jgi:hypothetical protein
MDPMNHYLRPPAKVGRSYWLALLAVCVLSALIALDAIHKARGAELAEARLARLSATQGSQTISVPKPTEPAVLKRWKSLQAERDFSWGDVFLAVEKASADEVELLAFEPDKANRTIQLRGEAHDQKALLEFIAALAHQPALKNVHLTRQQKSKRDRVDTMLFEVKAHIAESSP